MKLSVCAPLLLCASSLYAQGQHRVPFTGAPPAKADWPSHIDDSVIPASPLPPPPSAPGGLVPLAALRVPPGAAKEIRLAEKYFNSGNLRASTDHLQKALRIYPDFPQAHTALGLQYFQLRDFDKALAEFRSASSLDPRLIEPVHNRSIALFALGRYPEAESAARHALDLDPQHKSARYMLGRILAAQNQYTPETLALLRDSRADYYAARLVLAQLLLNHARPGEAVSELRAYLEVPNAPDKDKIACSVARLTNTPATPSCFAP